MTLPPIWCDTAEVVRYYAELAPLDGWRWSWLWGGVDRCVLAGHHRHGDGHDTLRITVAGSAYLVRRDTTLTTVLARRGRLDELVALAVTPC